MFTVNFGDTCWFSLRLVEKPHLFHYFTNGGFHKEYQYLSFLNSFQYESHVHTISAICIVMLILAMNLHHRIFFLYSFMTLPFFLLYFVLLICVKFYYTASKLYHAGVSPTISLVPNWRSINTTVSTWHDSIRLMSGMYFTDFTFRVTGQA